MYNNKEQGEPLPGSGKGFFHYVWIFCKVLLIGFVFVAALILIHNIFSTEDPDSKKEEQQETPRRYLPNSLEVSESMDTHGSESVLSPAYDDGTLKIV